MSFKTFAQFDFRKEQKTKDGPVGQTGPLVPGLVMVVLPINCGDVTLLRAAKEILSDIKYAICR